jgi:RNA polymerase sigma-70 factor (ECF subfamily)
MAATLVRIFGLRNLAAAEDVVQEAFCRALEVWPFRGTPQDPAAWLMATAKNCALDVLRRERTTRSSAVELTQALQSEWTLAPTLEELFAPEQVKDDLLRMMFSCCHSQLSETAQVALILHILCGFSVEEVAAAFMSSRVAMAKRIDRAKRTLAQSGALFNVAAERDFRLRLPAVQRALYLLFNEGYHGASAEIAVHAELCREASRLTTMLLEHPLGATPTTYALAALMAFNSARLSGRTDAAGNLIALADQDRSKWDLTQIEAGLRFLETSAVGVDVSAYHIEAAIASLHATARAARDTDWETIVSLYGALMSVAPSPVVALNRAIAIAQAHGPERALDEIKQIGDSERLAGYPFYSAALGELELRRGRRTEARRHFQEALRLTRNASERNFIDSRLRACAETDWENPDPGASAGETLRT